MAHPALQTSMNGLRNKGKGGVLVEEAKEEEEQQQEKMGEEEGEEEEEWWLLEAIAPQVATSAGKAL